MSNIKKSLTIATKIKIARKERGLSQQELGKTLKLSDKAISSYEVGRAEPSLETLRSISKATHKPITYFIEEADTSDLDLQLRINSIEQDLLEIKKLLQQRVTDTK